MLSLKASPRRLAPPRDMDEGQFDQLTRLVSRLAIVFIGIVVLIAALQVGRPILLPVSLAVIVGLMFGPVADYFERRGVPPSLSAAIVVFGFIALIVVALVLFAVPLSEWVERGPAIWDKFRTQMLQLREPLEALSGLQDQLKTVFGGDAAVEVAVQEGNPVTDLAFTVPAILGDILIFLVSLYFYLATRDNIRISILSLCVTRPLRWRTAHVFRDVESKVSRFLLAVTLLNVCVGIAVGVTTWVLGLPSPLLWGAMAFVLNYIPYVGQAVMIAVLFAVGMGTQSGLGAALAPIGVYAVINFLDGQVAFPHLIGRAVTLNPFLIFLSIVFWIWVWGPFGALVAVPSLLIVQSFIAHVLPSRAVAPRRPVRRTAKMTETDVILANAARVIKEQAEDEAKAAEEAAQAKEAAAALAAETVEPAPKPRRRRTVKPKPATA